MNRSATKKRSRKPSNKTSSRKASTSPNHQRKRAVLAHHQPVARAVKDPPKTEKMAKLSVLQYADTDHHLATYRNPASTSNSTIIVDPGDYAIFIHTPNSQRTFLYRPITVLGEPCVAEYDNMRRSGGIKSLLAGSMGDRDVEVQDLDHVRQVIGATQLESSMSACDWALRVLRNCEDAGYLRGRPSFP